MNRMSRKKKEAVEEEAVVVDIEAVTDNLIDESVEADTPVDIEAVTDNLIDESVEADTPVEIKKPAENEEIKLTGNSVQELQVAIRKLL